MPILLFHASFSLKICAEVDTVARMKLFGDVCAYLPLPPTRYVSIIRGQASLIVWMMNVLWSHAYPNLQWRGWSCLQSG